MEELTKAQRHALAILSLAAERATESGLFDVMMAYVNNPDSINDVCDVVTKLEKEAA